MLEKVSLVCPQCRSNLKKKVNAYFCMMCDAEFYIKSDRAIFCNNKYDEINDSLDKLKLKIKKFKTLYSFIVWLIAPICFSKDKRNFVRKLIHDKNGIFLNIGSGNTVVHKNFINIDIFPYENVHIQCDILNLPIADNSVDIVYTSSVLEHCSAPIKVIKEFHRILKKGGIIYSDIPFLCGFHASPNDFHRWTLQGAKNLHKDFNITSIQINSGPTSALLWIAQEWFATILSFGNRQAHQFFLIIFLLLTFPVKFLDILLKSYPTSSNISAGFIIIARK